MTLHDFRGLSCKVGDPVELPRAWTNANERRHRPAERAGIELEAIAGDDPVVLESLNSVGYGGRGHIEATPELGHRHARIFLELVKESDVHRVESGLQGKVLVSP
jgi:hypothetical protein